MTSASAERHLSIDAVRGFAVLGILLMNIVGMGLPSFAYLDPTYAGGSTGADMWTWAVNNVLTDGKMRALFTMLFGASMVLIADRAEAGSGLSPAATHYRRMLWLLLIGLVQTFAISLDVSVASVLQSLGIDAAPSGGVLGDLWNVTIAQIGPIIPYLLLVLVLIARPTGLLGNREA